MAIILHSKHCRSVWHALHKEYAYRMTYGDFHLAYYFFTSGRSNLISPIVLFVRFIFANLTWKFRTEQTAEFTRYIHCTNSTLTTRCLDLSDFTKLPVQIYTATALYSKQWQYSLTNMQTKLFRSSDANRKFGQLFKCIGLITTRLSPEIVMKKYVTCVTILPFWNKWT